MEPLTALIQLTIESEVGKMQPVVKEQATNNRSR